MIEFPGFLYRHISRNLGFLVKRGRADFSSTPAKPRAGLGFGGFKMPKFF